MSGKCLRVTRQDNSSARGCLPVSAKMLPAERRIARTPRAQHERQPGLPA